MENLEKIETLQDMKIIAITLYEMYMGQANQNNLEMDCYHENEHDNSRCHPNYHSNSHDNTPGKMMTLSLTKNATN